MFNYNNSISIIFSYNMNRNTLTFHKLTQSFKNENILIKM